MLGIIQEQHPDRCRLFMQWREMKWPIMVDALNRTQIRVVPVTYAIDQHGVIRFVNLKPEQLDEFMDTNYPEPVRPAHRPPMQPSLQRLEAATRQGSLQAWRAYGDALFLWGPPARLDEAIRAYEKTLEKDPNDGASHFRLGSAHRRRYDSPYRSSQDFRTAMHHWTRALALDPNHYIRRRRVQQYGPRLTKPYPFYDWVEQARTEIHARGDQPVRLSAEPGGAEIARPSKHFEVSHTTGSEEIDGADRIHRDTRGFVEVEVVVVPSVIQPGDAVRVHLAMQPNHRIKAHWNNEVEPLRLWIAPRAGWQVDRDYVTVANPAEPVSAEDRSLQFEVQSPAGAPSGTFTLPVYALYYVCEDVDGTCLFRRRDIPIEIRVEAKAEPNRSGLPLKGAKR